MAIQGFHPQDRPFTSAPGRTSTPGAQGPNSNQTTCFITLQKGVIKCKVTISQSRFTQPAPWLPTTRYIFKLPFDCSAGRCLSCSFQRQLSAIIDVGYTGALEAYVLNMDAGDSSVAAVLDEPGDFVGSHFPHIAAGTNIIVTVDYDGAGGTAAQTSPWCLPSRKADHGKETYRRGEANGSP